MINFDRLLSDFEQTVKNLAARGVEREFLVETKSKILKKREITSLLNELRNQRNKLNKKVSNSSAEGSSLKEAVAKMEEALKEVSSSLEEKVSFLPNIPSDDFCWENKVLRKKFFSTKFSSLCYEEIIKKIDFVNFKDAAKISGSKFVIYNEEATKFLYSLMNFMLSENRRNGYGLVSTPYLVKNSSLYNTGQIPKFSNDVFRVENTKLSLIPTSEVTLVNIYSDRIIEEKSLPIKISTYSPCFREEAGSAGKENKSLIRLHQFNKVEIVKITKPGESYKELDLLLDDVCSILEKLEISYRVLMLSVKELGVSSAKTYDVEVWLPNSQKWIEVSSCSNCEDFQANRSKIRSKIKGKNTVLHTINGSSLAIDRLMVAILEYYYEDKENLLKIPKALLPFYNLY